MTIRNLTDALTTCGVDLPKEALDLMAVCDVIREDQQSRRVEQVHEIADDLTADNALEHVTRLTQQRVENDLRDVVSSQLLAATQARAARAITSQADSLIAAYRKRFDAAVKVITKHAATYSPDDKPETVLARGPEASAAWAAILEASAVLDAGVQLWTTLYERPATTDALVATFDGDHWRRVDSADIFDAGRWHGLVAAGYTLRLNTYPEAMKLVASTPERQVRWEQTRRDGFTTAEPVRA